MASRIQRFHLVFVTLIAFVLAPVIGWADGMHGVMMVVKGDVQILAASDGKTHQAKFGSKVYPKDKITTGKDSRAKVVMKDKNIINISPDTEMSIDNYVNESSTGTKKVDLSVLKGKIRSTVMQKYDGEKNTFEVKTPTAVAGVRGTDFLTGHDTATKQSQFTTFHGSVAVKTAGNINPVMVTPGRQFVSNGQGAGTLVTLKPRQLADFNKESTAEGQIFNQEDQRQPAQDLKSTPEKDSEETASEPGVSADNTGGPDAEAPEEKAPASVATDEKKPASSTEAKREPANQGSSSMITSEDVAPATAKQITIAPAAPPRLPASMIPNPSLINPNTDFVREQIRSGKANVKVRVVGP